MLQDLPILLLPALALVPVLESHEEESVIGGPHEAEQAEACHGRGVLHSGRIRQDLFDFRGGILRTLDGGGVGELKMQEQIALIFIRQEARGNLACKVSRGSAEGDQHYKRDRAFSNQRSRPVYILIPDASKDAIEQIEEPADGTFGLLPGP